jgi:hypothetical protein
MKKYILFSLLFFVLASSLFANEFSIEKINTFAFAQRLISPESLIIDQPYLYALTPSGLEIYEIQANAQLQKISELPIMCSNKLVKKDNYIYIGSDAGSEFDPSPLFIYQVDISDKENPYIHNTIEFDNSYVYISPEIVGNYLITSNNYHPDNVYTLPDLELYTTIQDCSIFLRQIKENICISPLGWSVFDIYDTSDLSDIQYLNTIDMSPYHQGCSPTSFKVINDTILIAAGQSAVSFWNIADISQWEYIGHYEPDEYLEYNSNFGLYDNNLILLKFTGLELIDISDLADPQSLDFISYSSRKLQVINDNENIYVGTVFDGIRIYYIANHELHFLENYFEYPYFTRAYLYLTHLFLETFNHGLYVFDISNPYEPVEIPTILCNTPYTYLQGNGELITVTDYEGINVKIFDITDPTNPVLRNIIPLTSSELYSSLVFFDTTEKDILYLFDINQGGLKKYDISEPGDPPLVFNYNEIPQKCSFFIKDGYGYALSGETYPQHLYIIGGLNSNNPAIIDTIENFSQYTYSPSISLCGDYLCLRYIENYKETKLYSLDNPEDPQLACTLEVPSINPPFIYDNLLFTTTCNLSFVYDLNECNGDTLESIDYFYGLYFMIKASCADINNKHYLFITEDSNVGVYEFSYTNAIDEEPQEISSSQIINYPNPFSTSTKISFNLHRRDAESAEIKIYNIKGQLVKDLEFSILNLEFGEAIWDGKDESGKQLPSGIYLYKLSSGEQSMVKKMLLLR